MSVHWVIEKGVFDEDALDLMITRLNNTGHTHSLITVTPFEDDVYGKKPEIPEGQSVFCYGSIGIQDVAHKNGWEPGVWLDASLDEDVVAENLGLLYLNSDARFVKLRDAGNVFSGEVFLKPAQEGKAFPGLVLRSAEITGWAEKQMRSGYLGKDALDMLVLVSPKKEIGCEWRNFIVDGRVITSCCYRQHQRIMPERWVPDEVTRFVEECVSRYSPLPGFVLDVGQVGDGTCRVIELNCLNSAGLYACDPARLVDAVNERVEREARTFATLAC